MSEDQLGKMPAGWHEVDLADFVPNPKSEIVDGPFGSNLKASEYTMSGVPIIRLQNIDRAHFIDKNIKFVTDEKAVELDRHNFKPSDIVITKLGAPLGKAAIVPTNFGPGVIVADVVRCRTDDQFANRSYLMHAINSPQVAQQLVLETKGTTRPRVNLKHIRTLRLPMAPRPEQDRIVEKIETLFARLDKGEEAVREVQKLLTRYRQSVLKSAVTGQLTADWRAERESDLEHGGDLLARILETRREQWAGRGKYKAPNDPNTSDLPDLPQGWVWASVDQLANIMGGLTKNSKRKEMPMTRPMLRVANVYQNRLELDDIHQTGITDGELSRVSLEARDILVVEGNGSKSQIGRMALWSGEIPNAVHQNHLIKVRLFEKALAEFMITWFQSLLGRQIVEKVASSTSGLYTLSISKIAAMVAPLPSLEEVNEIMGEVEEAHSKIAVLEDWCETELKRSASLRQSILKDAFAGRLVPQDPSDEPASALLARIAEAKAQSKSGAKKTRRKASA